MAKKSKYVKVDSFVQKNGTQKIFSEEEMQNNSGGAAKMEDKRVEKAIGTESWRPDIWNNDFYTPANLLKVDLKPELNLKGRWVRDDHRSKVKKRLQQGYIFATEDMILNFNQLPLQFGGQKDSNIRVRECIYMVIDKNYKKLIDKHIESKIIDPNIFRKQTAERIKRAGGRVIGEDEASSMKAFEFDKSVADNEIPELM